MKLQVLIVITYYPSNYECGCCCVLQAEADTQLEGLQLREQQVVELGEQLQQLQQEVTADLSHLQQEVQQQLARHGAEVARDTIKQIKADQVGLA